VLQSSKWVAGCLKKKQLEIYTTGNAWKMQQMFQLSAVIATRNKSSETKCKIFCTCNNFKLGEFPLVPTRIVLKEKKNRPQKRKKSNYQAEPSLLT
jgi:hypothetical protein